jgi:hypothetical protein
VVSLKTRVFWGVRLCWTCGAFVCWGQPVQEANGYTTILFKKLVTTYPVTQYYIPEDLSLQVRGTFASIYLVTNTETLYSY